MADLGTKLVGLAREYCSYKAPWWPVGVVTKISSPWISRSVRIGMLQGVPKEGTFYGSVTEANTPVPNAVVRVYERATGYFVVETRSAADGTFTIPNQRQASSDYYVIALDPEGGALYNALIFDRVAPV